MSISEASRLRSARRAALGLASGVQLKYFLRYQQLPAGMGDSRLEVIQRVLSYVETGRLAGEVVDRAAVEFLEYRNKRVYLFQADPEHLARLEPDRFPSRIRRWAEARIPALPDAPRVNYSYVDAHQIRVTFSETHRHPTVDLAAERVGWRRRGKVIVLDADRRTGFVALGFDAPGLVHPHGSRALDFFAHYTAKAETLLGTRLLPFPMQRALLRLEAGSLVRVQQGRGSTLDGRIDILASGPDVRAMPAFHAVRPTLAARDSGRYIWLPQEHAPDGAHQRPLLREVPTEIHAATSMVRFTRDSLVHEVRYVLGQIQAHA